MTPREKYMRDPEYHALVAMLESFIERCQFSPTELREAALLACIRYEERRPARHLFIDAAKEKG